MTERHGSRWIILLLVAALVVSGGLAWWLFDSESSGSARAASIDDIVGAPAEWAGEKVQVTGRVVSVYPGAFTVGSSDAELLVLPPAGDGSGRTVGPGDLGKRLRIVGTVRRFDEQVQLVPGPENEPRQGDAILRAQAIERVGGGAT